MLLHRSHVTTTTRQKRFAHGRRLTTAGRRRADRTRRGQCAHAQNWAKLHYHNFHASLGKTKQFFYSGMLLIKRWNIAQAVTGLYWGTCRMEKQSGNAYYCVLFKYNMLPYVPTPSQSQTWSYFLHTQWHNQPPIHTHTHTKVNYNSQHRYMYNIPGHWPSKASMLLWPWNPNQTSIAIINGIASIQSYEAMQD